MRPNLCRKRRRPTTQTRNSRPCSAEPSFKNRKTLWGVTKNQKIPNLNHVYSGRSVIPAKFTELKVCVANTGNRTQTLKKGNELGNGRESRNY